MRTFSTCFNVSYTQYFKKLEVAACSNIGYFFVHCLYIPLVINNMSRDTETPVVSRQYTTRSGRAVRQAVRYEPDPDTVFIDDDEYYIESDGSDGESVIVSDSDEENGSICESELEDESDCESDNSDSSSVVSEPNSDIIDWDALTDQASDDDLVDTDMDESGDEM